jgi:hypothetical protein
MKDCCYSTRLDLSELGTNTICISDVMVTIKVDWIFDMSTMLVLSLHDCNHHLLVAVNKPKFHIVIINNILYFLLENKPVLITEVTSPNFSIESNLKFVPDEYDNKDTLCLINPKSKNIPYIDISGNIWEICFHEKVELDVNRFIVKKDNTYYCSSKEEIIKIVYHNDNVKYVIPC